MNPILLALQPTFNFIPWFADPIFSMFEFLLFLHNI